MLNNCYEIVFITIRDASVPENGCRYYRKYIHIYTYTHTLIYVYLINKLFLANDFFFLMVILNLHRHIHSISENPFGRTSRCTFCSSDSSDGTSPTESLILMTVACWKIRCVLTEQCRLLAWKGKKQREGTDSCGGESKGAARRDGTVIDSCD